MKLLTKKLRDDLPPLYAQDGKEDEAIVYAKFFTPDSNWTWYVLEFDGDNTFFGLVHGFEKELGYFALSELEDAKGPLGLKIERDLHWVPTKIGDVKGGKKT